MHTQMQRIHQQHPGLVMLDCHSCSAWHVDNDNHNESTNSNNSNDHCSSINSKTCTTDDGQSSDGSSVKKSENEIKSALSANFNDLASAHESSTLANETRPFSLRQDRKSKSTPPCRVPGVFIRATHDALRKIKAEKLMTILFSHGNGEDIGMLLEELAGLGERVQVEEHARA